MAKTFHSSSLVLQQQPAYIVALSNDDIAAKTKVELVQLVIQAREEIDVLTQALAVSGADLGLEKSGDLKSVLLYDLALSQQARAALAIDLARRTEKLKNLQKTVSTLSFVREANNLELLKCERRIKELEQLVANQQTQLVAASLNQEKHTSLITSHHKLSDQLTESQLRAATMERERDTLSSQLQALTVSSREAERQCTQHQQQHQQQLAALSEQHQHQLATLREQHKDQLDNEQEQNVRREAYAQREHERHQQQLMSVRDQHLKQMEVEQEQRERREQQAKREVEQLNRQHEHEIGRLHAQLDQLSAEVAREKSRLRTEHAEEQGKLQEKNSLMGKELERLEQEVEKLKSKEGEAQGKLKTLREEYARQGRMNSFQEVVGTQMANVRAQLDEAKQMYERVNAENAVLASENARLLLLLDEDIKAKSSPHNSPISVRPSSAAGRPASVNRASSFIELMSNTSPLPKSPLSSPMALHSSLGAESDPLQFASSSPPSSDLIKRRPRSNSASASTSTSRSATPEPPGITAPIASPLLSKPATPPTAASNPTTPTKKVAKRSPLLARRQAIRSLSSSSLSSESDNL